MALRSVTEQNSSPVASSEGAGNFSLWKFLDWESESECEFKWSTQRKNASDSVLVLHASDTHAVNFWIQFAISGHASDLSVTQLHKGILLDKVQDGLHFFLLIVFIQSCFLQQNILQQNAISVYYATFRIVLRPWSE